jgi:hypothetical protein
MISGGARGESPLSNKIIHVAIHDLLKTSDGFQVKIGKDQLAVTTTTQRVIDDLYDLYSRRASKSHGKFSSLTTIQGLQIDEGATSRLRMSRG